MRSIAYIRVSTTKQDTDNQKLKLLEYSQLHKFNIDKFLEVEVSSRKNQRERKLNELLELLNDGDSLYITELSRLGRNMLEVLTFIEKLRNKKINVVFVNQPELSTSDNKALDSLKYAIFGFLAESERDFISTRTKQGLVNAKANGKTLGRKTGSLSKSQYDIKDNHILELFNKNVSATTIVKLIGYGSAKTILEWKKKRIEHNALLDTLCFNEAYRNFKENK